jgi:hypothetical protein
MAETVAVARVCHACVAPATLQWQRRATDAEAAAQTAAIEEIVRFTATPEYIAERYGVLREGVFGCAGHDLSPQPADPSPAALAAAKQAGADARARLHDADCGGHGHCTCAGVPATSL